MVHHCIKCNGVFSSNYNLTRHLNRKYPCDMILECAICNKIFTKQYDLTNHLNKKYPCLNPQEYLNLKEKELEINSEKNVLKAKIIENKAKDNAEKNILREKEIQINIERNTIKNKELLDKVVARESQLLRLQESERLKTIRKERTPAVIQQINIDIQINNFIKNIEENCFHICDLPFEYVDTHKDMIFNNLLCDGYSDITEEQEAEIFKDLFYNNSSTDKIIKDIIIRSYNDPANQDSRSIFYFKSSDKFYAIFINDGIKILKMIDYKKDLFPILSHTVNQYLNKIVRHIPIQQIYFYANDVIDTKMFTRQKEVEFFTRTNMHDELKKYSEDIFEYPK